MYLKKPSFVGGLHGVVAKMLKFNIVVSEFELQSCYHVLFWTIYLGKVRTPFSPCNPLNSTSVFQQLWLWH